MTGQRGATLIEVLIAAGLFLLLSLLMVLGWSQGARAWRTVSERNEVLGQAQRFLRLTEKELETASASGLEIAATGAAMAYASTFGVSNPETFEVDSASGALRWQKQVIVFYDPANRAVLRRQMPVSVTDPAYLVPTPISSIDLGSGLRAVAFYATSGQVAARQISALSFSIEGRQVTIRVGLLTQQNRQANFESSTLLRN
jgi:type II secretory pathway pseudopilin PulG